MLTKEEIVRQVVMRLSTEPSIKNEWLRRRAVKPGRIYTKREFRKLRRQVLPVIHVCVNRLNEMMSNLVQAESSYHAHSEQAPIDVVFDVVSEHLHEYMMKNRIPIHPPELRRTCTGYFGSAIHPESIEFTSWEV